MDDTLAASLEYSLPETQVFEEEAASLPEKPKLEKVFDLLSKGLKACGLLLHLLLHL